MQIITDDYNPKNGWERIKGSCGRFLYFCCYCNITQPFLLLFFFFWVAVPRLLFWLAEFLSYLLIQTSLYSARWPWHTLSCLAFLFCLVKGLDSSFLFYYLCLPPPPSWKACSVPLLYNGQSGMHLAVLTLLTKCYATSLNVEYFPFMLCFLGKVS